MKKVLITGANSYIGTSFEKYIKENYPDEFQIDTLDMKDPNWKKHDFSDYDSVFHVAGIAHADVGHVSEETKQLYYRINTDLAIETAKKAKVEKVKQFIFMSSMIVYSGCKETYITKETIPKAENFYGDSKLQADLAIQELNVDTFKTCVIRPPMIYGKGSKGNYKELSKLATKLPIFPKVNNKRSMLYIGNLCEFIRLIIIHEDNGVFFPQNREFTNTSNMVKLMSIINNHRLFIMPFTSFIIKIISKLPGKTGNLANKAFGDSYYDMSMSLYNENYQITSLKQSIILTESNTNINNTNMLNSKKKVLLIALPGYSKGIADKMIDLGYEVLHINDKPNDGVLCKTLGRLKVPFYLKIIDNYYKQILESFECVNFDYVLAIRGEYTPIDTLKYLNSKFPKAKRILYMWDSIINNKDIDKKWEYYNEVYTFDRIDYLNNKEIINFLPLFYYEDYLPQNNKKQQNYKYDIAFIGTGHGDRVKIAKQVSEQCEKSGLKCYIYVFLPHKLIYIKNKLFNRDYKNVKIKDVHFKMLPIKEAYKIYNQAMCVMDIESKTQNGLTMRTIEMIGLKKKLITTNKDIKYYDFYNENNIMISNRENFILNTHFFNKEYEKLDENLYIKYSLSNWINELLGDEK